MLEVAADLSIMAGVQGHFTCPVMIDHPPPPPARAGDNDDRSNLGNTVVSQE